MFTKTIEYRTKLQFDISKHEVTDIPRERIVKEIHIPLYLKPYMSLVLGTDKILVPYATSNLLTSLKSSIPFGDEISKVKR